MPDPVTGTSPAIQTIDLQPVVITGSATKPGATVPVPIAEVARECVDEASAVAVAVLSRAVTTPTLAVLATGAASLTFGACAAKSIEDKKMEASIRRAIDRCVDGGGMPAGAFDGTLTCIVVE